MVFKQYQFLEILIFFIVSKTTSTEVNALIKYFETLI